MSRPRILLVTPWPPPADGIANHSVHLATALARHADVVVLCRPSDGGSHVVVDGVRIVPVLHSARLARQAVRDIAPDAVYVQFAVPAFGTSLVAVLAACRAARTGGARVAIVFHEAIREADRLRAAVVPLYRAVLACCDVAVVLTPAAAAVLRRCGATDDRIELVSHGVPLLSGGAAAAEAACVEAVADPGARPMVLCLGFIHPDKGVDLVVRALALLRDGDRPLPAVVVAGSVRRRSGIFRWFGAADARHLADLHRLTAELDLVDHVEFAGFLPNDMLLPTMAAATVLALPYRSTTQSGIAALSAAAAVPVVASRLPGLVDFLGSGAIYSEPGDVAGLAASIDAVVTDRSLRAQMVAAQRQNRTEQSMDAVAERVVGVLGLTSTVASAVPSASTSALTSESTSAVTSAETSAVATGVTA